MARTGHRNSSKILLESNRNVGGDVLADIRRRKAANPALARAVQAEFDRLELARSLRLLREKCGLSQHDVAVRIGSKQPSIARLESGRVAPNLDFLARVAAALDARLKVEVVATPRPSPSRGRRVAARRVAAQSRRVRA